MADIVERLERETFVVNTSRTRSVLHDSADEITRLRAEVAEVRYWNEAVAVCKDHVDFIVSVDPGDCVICDNDRLRSQLAEAREALNRMVAMAEVEVETRTFSKLSLRILNDARATLERIKEDK